ncbi:hypothetical protein H0H81_003142 [Sphagnurus paluster]|uniref:Uncharacterized protein n=1 Tax=Sphagnurus paluster TaxID=117069 RepID=A0A9P7FYZ1_9AGAR|nr:hypothetical protein H0H81_003142 [Sphagnurus paluster]
MASPGTTPVKGRWRQMARRASTLLPTAISRPTTPAASVRDPDATSLKGSANDSSTSLPLASPPLPALSPAAPAFSQPSPIAESPAREYAALQEAVLSAQPSPLVQSQVVAPEETRAPGPSKLIDSSAVGPGGYTDGYETLPQPTVAKPAPQVEPTPEPTTAPNVADSSAVGPGGFSGDLDELPKPVVIANDPVSPQSEIASPTGYIPPPLIDSSAVGPGGFSDGVDDLPQGEVLVDPFQPQQGRAPVYDEPTALPAPVAAEPVVVAPAAPQPVAVAPAPPQPVVSRAAPETATPLPQRSDAFFESPVNDEPLELEEENPVAPTRSVDVFGPVAAPTAPTAPTASITASPQPQAMRQLVQPETRAIPTQVAAVVVPQPEFERAPIIPVQMPTPRRPPSDLPTFVPAPAEPAMDMPVPQHQTPAPAPQVLPPASPPSQSAYPVPLPIFDFRSEQEAWGGVAPKAPEQQQSRGMNGGAVEMSRSSSIRMPLINPFDDPVAPRITVTQPEGVPMPYPQHQEPIGPTEQIVMPLPPAHEVIPSRSPQTFPYAQGYLPADNEFVLSSYHLVLHSKLPHSETRPLLSGSAPKNVSYLQPSNASNFMNVSQNGMPSSVAWPVQETTYGPRLHDLGWIEYRLPDGTVYYVHPTCRVAADLDLRNDTTLDIVTAQLAHQKDVPAGMELWLRQDVSATSDRRPGLHIVRFWINHKQRMVSLDQSAANGSAGRNPKAAAEDQTETTASTKKAALAAPGPCSSSVPAPA